MKKSLIFSAVTLLSLTAGLTGCKKDTPSSGGGASTPSITDSVPATSVPEETTAGDGDIALKMWSAADDFGVLKQIITNFNAARKAEKKSTVKVNLVGIGANDVGTKFASDPTTGPDVFHLPGNDIASFVKNKSLASFSASDLTAGKNDIPAATLKTGQIEDTTYALPYTINTYVAFYRKDKVNSNQIQSVQQIQGLINTTENAKNKGIYVDVGNGFYTQSFIRSVGLNFYGNNGADGTVTDILPTNENAMKMANLIYDIYHDGKWNTIPDGSIDALAAGETLVNVDGFWNLENYRKAVNGENNERDNLGIAVLPKLDVGGLDVNWGAPIDNKFIAVNSAAQGDKGEAAKALALYMVSPDGQKTRFEVSQVVPTSSSLLEDAEFKKNFIGADAVNAYLKADYNFSNPTLSGWNDKYWKAAEAFGGTIKAMTSKDDAAIQKAVKDFGEAILIK